MLNTFHPSAIANNIYDILEDYAIKIDVYECKAIDAIINYFNSINTEYRLYRSEWPNAEGGVCSVAFVDNSHPQLIMFDYEY